MLQINLFIGSRYPVNRKRLRECAKQALMEKNISDAQIDVSVVGVRKITQLNQDRMGKEGPTDVLSFPQHERHQLHDFPLPPGMPPHLGDVVISFPAAVQTAKKFGKLVDDQICFYLEHSILHLLGYHHD